MKAIKNRLNNKYIIKDISNKLCYAMVLGLLCINCASCGNITDEDISSSTDAYANKEAMPGYVNINNIYYKTDGYLYESDNQGTLVYFTEDRTEYVSVCAKINEGMTIDKVYEMYDLDISGYYGDNYTLDEYKTGDMTWRVYVFSNGTKQNENQTINGYLYVDEANIIYVENGYEKTKDKSEYICSLIDSIIIK